MCIRDRPKTILTDNGTQFTSKSWTENLEKVGIRPKYTAIRNPSTNLSERVNRQLGNLFRILVGGHHKMCIRDRIKGYQHKFIVTDATPYCLRGWPIPLKYQDAVDQEIRTLEEYKSSSELPARTSTR